MDVTILRKESFTTSQWSGGDTTQLYIYPDDADYAKGSFQIRISTATVLADESSFTSLVGVERFLMILEGEMKLVHQNIRERFMKPYDIDQFMGEWNTISYGRVRDFNLMLKNGAGGLLEYLAIPEKERVFLPINKRGQKTILYVIAGTGRVQGYQMKASELVLLDAEKGEEAYLSNIGNEVLKLAVCCISIA